jgi:hypothetical protein
MFHCALNILFYVYWSTGQLETDLNINKMLFIRLLLTFKLVRKFCTVYFIILKNICFVSVFSWTAFANVWFTNVLRVIPCKFPLNVVFGSHLMFSLYIQPSLFLKLLCDILQTNSENRTSNSNQVILRHRKTCTVNPRHNRPGHNG